ncbi:unnamed protein product [Heligmosomoides polygyrus]|uniref:FAD-binding PCMH-type domain-containing protein n=1 Tax=Heligmosomoides polygyrus TaxID=6339 RepID=A0A183FIZ6_HELPZ|nr:unnamed protein product [Heligmosomoides polygyrus]
MLKSVQHSVRRLASSARNPAFATVEGADIRVFESICGRDHVKTTDIGNYRTDWTKAFRGNPPCVLLPSSSEEVSAILAHCARRRIAVVPQAGNTGLVGGSVPVHDEIVLSVKRINKHFEFDETSEKSPVITSRATGSGLHGLHLPSPTSTIVEIRRLSCFKAGESAPMEKPSRFSVRRSKNYSKCVPTRWMRAAQSEDPPAVACTRYQVPVRISRPGQPSLPSLRGR